jgi:hypothetical protein
VPWSTLLRAEVERELFLVALVLLDVAHFSPRRARRGPASLARKFASRLCDTEA